GEVLMGGGVIFRLLAGLERFAVLVDLRESALAGASDLGAGAVSVIADPTLMTNIDIPIVQPRSFTALGLVPFQINAHYLDPDPSSRHMGETREERLREFLEVNRTPVVGLREGTWIRVDGKVALLGGRTGARIFRTGEEPIEAPPGSNIDLVAH